MKRYIYQAPPPGWEFGGMDQQRHEEIKLTPAEEAASDRAFERLRDRFVWKNGDLQITKPAQRPPNWPYGCVVQDDGSLPWLGGFNLCCDDQRDPPRAARRKGARS
jgi:hypothetical protein